MLNPGCVPNLFPQKWNCCGVQILRWALASATTRRDSSFERSQAKERRVLAWYENLGENAFSHCWKVSRVGAAVSVDVTMRAYLHCPLGSRLPEVWAPRISTSSHKPGTLGRQTSRRPPLEPCGMMYQPKPRLSKQRFGRC